MNRRIAIMLMAILVIPAAVSCGGVKKDNAADTQSDWIRTVMKSDVRHLASYSFNPASSIAERIVESPAMLLDYLREMDKKKYASRVPSVTEKSQVMDVIAILPPLYRKVFAERLVAICLVDDFIGNGMADWIVDDRGNYYFYIVLNTAVFSGSFAERVSLRENSCLVPGSGVKIEVRTGTNVSGLLYTLLHEGAHAVDYAMKITPFTEIAIQHYEKFILNNGLPQKDFTRGYWTGISQPVAAYDFPERKMMHFFGYTRPEMGAADTLKALERLTNLPFASLYGCQSWAEDLADFVTFYHMKKAFRQPLEYRLFISNQPAGVFRTLGNPGVTNREALIEKTFY